MEIGNKKFDYPLFDKISSLGARKTIIILLIRSNLVGDGLEQLMMPVGNVTCNGFVKSELVSLLNDQCSVSKVKSTGQKQFDTCICKQNISLNLILIKKHTYLPSFD